MVLFKVYNEKSFSPEFKGKILSKDEILLYEQAKTRSPVKSSSNEREKIGIEYYLEATSANFKQSIYKLIETELIMNCDLVRSVNLGCSISKAVFEYINEEKLKSVGKVLIKKKENDNLIFKIYNHDKNSFLVKEIKPKIVKQEIFITNKFTKYIFFKYTVCNIRLCLNLHNGLIEMKYKLLKEDFDETKMQFEIENNLFVFEKTIKKDNYDSKTIKNDSKKKSKTIKKVSKNGIVKQNKTKILKNKKKKQNKTKFNKNKTK
jgi:hypothetical protein